MAKFPKTRKPPNSLKLSGFKIGAPGRIRTVDQLIKSQYFSPVETLVWDNLS